MCIVFFFVVMFGLPTVSAAGFVGMLAATLSSVIESIGDYFAAARISNGNPPPAHALNRGIAAEGFSSIISGMVGAGHATTSYSGNIGAIGITKVFV
jgi:nucleobase transporter 1/2